MPSMNDRKKEYRSRLYTHYVTTQLQLDTQQIHDHLRRQAPYLRHLIRRWIPQDRNITILDLGCGYGALLYFLKEAGYRACQGIDVSPEQVAVAGQLGLVTVQQGDVFDILRKTEDASYHVIIAFDVLEHFDKQEILAITDEVHRVLRKEGKFIVHVPNGEAIFSGRIHCGDLTHETCFTRQSVSQLMGTVGFRTVSFAEDIPVVHGITSGVRHILWRGFRSLFRLIHIAETGDKGQDLVLTQNLIAVAEK